eukprot:TRINITY_DN24860_c0_g1_i1.p1 TRINITY_DN24860_c0_g1~~TRINITY_DN24860_c0_g1_i1.p1  ORF type:complete len:1014 (-),score=287.94 TRINITY_DN24860_c0_g1_i1:118-3111(-)
MEVTPHRHVVRLSHLLSSLAQLFSEALPLGHVQRAEAQRVSGEARAFAATHAFKAVSDEHVQTLFAKVGEAAAAKAGEEAATIKAGAVEETVDVMRYKLLEVRCDLDFLRSSLQQKEASGVALMQEVGQLKQELQQLQAADASKEEAMAALAKSLRESKQELGEYGQQLVVANARVSKVSDEESDFMAQARQEADCFRRMLEDAKDKLEDKAAHLEGFVGAMDTDHSLALKSLSSWREEITAEIPTRMEAMEAKVLEAMNEALSKQKGEFDQELQSVQSTLRSEDKLQAEKQAKVTTELSRLNRTLEKKMTTSVQEADDALRRLIAEGLERLEQRAERSEETLRQANQRVEEESRSALQHQTEDTHQRISSLSESLLSKLQQLGSEMTQRSDKDVTDMSARLSARSADLEAATESLKKQLTAQLGEAVQKLEVRDAEVATKAASELAQIKKSATDANARVEEQIQQVDHRLGSIIQEAQEASTRNVQGAREASNAALNAACDDLLRRSAQEVSKLRDEIHVQVTSLRSELQRSFEHSLDRSVAGVQTSMRDLRGEILQTQDIRQQAMMQSVTAIGTQGNGEAAALRGELEALGGELGRLAQSSGKQEDRLEARVKDVRDELAGAVRALAEQVHIMREGLQREVAGSLQHAVQHAETCLHRRFEADTQRCMAKMSETLEARLEETWKHEEEATRLPMLTLQKAEVTAIPTSPREDAKRIDDAASELPTPAEIVLALSDLSEAILQIASCCGFLGGEGLSAFTDNDEDNVRFQELLAWHRGGLPLASRIALSWEAQVKAHAGTSTHAAPVTLLSLLSKRAEADSLHALEAAVKDLDTRLLARAMSETAHATSPPTLPARGEALRGAPFAGAFGASQLKVRRAAALNTAEGDQKEEQEKEAVLAEPVAASAKSTAQAGAMSPSLPGAPCIRRLPNLSSRGAAPTSKETDNSEQMPVSDLYDTLSRPEPMQVRKPDGPPPSGDPPLHRRLQLVGSTWVSES